MQNKMYMELGAKCKTKCIWNRGQNVKQNVYGTRGKMQNKDTFCYIMAIFIHYKVFKFF